MYDSIGELCIIESDTWNPYYNLALEEYLFTKFKPGVFILFLWQNDNTIVVGHNQSVYTQCNLNAVREYKTKIARRRSGGGAVYHDTGNLNYSFIYQYNFGANKDINYKIIIEALALCGINASVSGKNDIELNGKKISGNAFYEEKNVICHHGTLLVDTDLDKMYRLLNVRDYKWRGKGIVSARSRTQNIQDICDTVSIEDMVEKIKSTAIKILDPQTVKYIRDIDIEDPVLQMLIRKYTSNEWNFEKRLDECLKIEKSFSWGSVEIELAVNSGRITEINIFSDCMYQKLIVSIQNMLLGVFFKKNSIISAFECDYKKNDCTTMEEIVMKDIEALIIRETIV